VVNQSESSVWVKVGFRDSWVWVNSSDCRPVDPSNCPEIPDSSSEPMRAAFEADSNKRYGWNQGYFGRIKNRYFDSFVEMLWQAFQAGTKYQSSPLAPSPCMDGVNVDQFIDGVMEARGRTSGLAVGDAVRFVSPGHERHGTEGIILSIVRGPNHQYRFDSNCGRFHRYCTATELERIIKRYREPTLADLANGPIACEYRDSDEEHWRSGFLVHILNGNIPFLCVNKERELSGQWDQCRIEVGE
jgi:hypothetical protein